MYESLKNLILHKAYESPEDAESRVKKAYPKWITEGQREELMKLVTVTYDCAYAFGSLEVHT